MGILTCVRQTCPTAVCSSIILVAAFFVGNATALTAADPEPEVKPVVLVPPFENQSKVHQKIQYEVGTGKQEGRPKRSVVVDRMTESPRSTLEDLLGQIDGVTIVERQRVDAFLLETEFGAMSGLVDQEKAIKLGKLLGANLIVMGAITDIREDTRQFEGYGVKSKTTDVICKIRVRLIDIASGTVKFSKIVKGTKSYTKTTYGQSDSNDRSIAAVEVPLQQLENDAEFKAALFGKKATNADGAPADGMVEVEFAPKPDNCDIEIEGKYVGGSPLKRRMPAGKEAKVRIAKGGYKDWEGVIVPEKGLKITRELAANR